MKIIKYNFLSCRINHGTEENPNYEDVIIPKEIRCTDECLEANEAIALKEAYNGEYTVEEIEEPETPATVEQRVADLEEALEMILTEVTE